MKEKETKLRHNLSENLKRLGINIHLAIPKELFKKNRLFFWINTIFESYERDFKKTRLTQATHLMEYLLEYMINHHGPNDNIPIFANNLVFAFNHWESTDDEIKFIKFHFFDHNASFAQVEFYNKWRSFILKRYGKPVSVPQEQTMSDVRVPKEQFLDFLQEILGPGDEVINKLRVRSSQQSRIGNQVISAFSMFQNVLNDVQKIRSANLDKNRFYIEEGGESPKKQEETFQNARKDEMIYLKNGFEFQLSSERASLQNAESRPKQEYTRESSSLWSSPAKSTIINMAGTPSPEKENKSNGAETNRGAPSDLNSGIQTPNPTNPLQKQAISNVANLAGSIRKPFLRKKKKTQKERKAILDELQENFFKFGNLSDWLDHNYTMEASEIQEIKALQKEKDKYFPTEQKYKPHVFANDFTQTEFTKQMEKEDEIDIQVNLRKQGWLDPADPSDFKDQHPHEIAENIRLLRKKLAEAKKEEEFLDQMVKGLVHVADFHMSELEEDVAMISICEEIVKRVKDDVKGREEYDSLLKKMDDQFLFDCRKAGRVEPEIYDFIKTKLMNLPKEVKIVDFMSAKKKLFQHFIDASNPFLMMIDDLEKNEEPIAMKRKRNYSLFDNVSFTQQGDEPIDIEKYRKEKKAPSKKEKQEEKKEEPMDEIDKLLSRKMNSSLNKRMSLLNPNFASKTDSVIEDPLERLLRMDLLGSLNKRQRPSIKKEMIMSSGVSTNKKPPIPIKETVIAEEKESDSEIHTDSESDEYD